MNIIKTKASYEPELLTWHTIKMKKQMAIIVHFFRSS